MTTRIVAIVLVCTACASGFQVQAAQAICRSGVGVSPAMMAGKGFGKKAAAPPPPPKKKSTASVRRDAAGEAFDDLKASGAPEYMVSIRTVDSSGKESKWLPVGGIAVPRSSSEDMALSMAIFNNEDDLLKGAFRAHPSLRNTDDRFEYGYRLKEFPDDPVKIASKENTEQTQNPIMQWFNALDNPLNK